jgi:hypothetical protein
MKIRAYRVTVSAVSLLALLLAAGAPRKWG